MLRLGCDQWQLYYTQILDCSYTRTPFAYDEFAEERRQTASSYPETGELDSCEGNSR